VYIARDGYAIADYSNEPDYMWHVAGGPTLMIDTEPSSVPEQINAILQQRGLLGKDIGIYRIVPRQPLTPGVAEGVLQSNAKQIERRVNGTKILARSYSYDLAGLISRLTLGALGPTLDLDIRDAQSEFWVPRVIRGLGITTADRSIKRWFNYLEIGFHVESAAWDRRAIWARVSIDLRRHFLQAVAAADKQGASISLDAATAPLDLLTVIPDRLAKVKDAIDGFTDLLDKHGSDAESTFHQYIAKHPVLLDVYGTAESKPRLEYPLGESPLGKRYVEPDFLIRYPGNRYKLIELERPSKRLATIKGEPRSGVTQAAWQIGEWKDYIQNHYELIRERYPGISSMPRTEVVISRSTAEQSGVSDVSRYLAMVRQQLNVDEVITYDLLLEQAREAYARLSGTL
jgi:hypothetical protein